MKYVSPLNKPEGSSYVEGNPATGVASSIVPAAAIEHPMREIVEVIHRAGLTPSPDVLTQLADAIQGMIQAALGGGAPADYVTLAALSSLPFYPEILSADNAINITSPAAGQILVPPSVAYRFRGVLNYNTSSFTEAQRLFTTLQNKQYHLVAEQSTGAWALRDVADPSYNPLGVLESDEALDGSRSRILAARVVTDQNNIPTITLLRNAHELFRDVGRSSYLQLGNFNNSHTDTHAIGWARRPRSIGLTRLVAAPSASLRDMGELQLSPTTITRYQMVVTAVVSGDPDGPVAWRQNYAPIYNYRLGA